MFPKALLPLSLTLFRLLLGPFALWFAWRTQDALNPWPRWMFLPILLAGLLSDIFDGVLARRLGVATPALRRFDSLTDVIYHLFLLAAAWSVAGDWLIRSIGWLAALLVSEALCIAVSLRRFGRLPATHSYLAKFYGLALFAAFTAVLCFNGPAWSIAALGVIGLLANAEIMAILCLSREAPVDVLSVFLLPKASQKTELERKLAA